MHRPSNVDRKEVLVPLFNFLVDEVAADMPLIWPIHPRAQKMLQTFSLWEKAMKTENLILLNPVGYHDMLRLNMGAKLLLTDSGGLQEESCVLGTPCLTLRWNTERPITLRENGGASVLVGNNVERIRKEYQATLRLTRKPQRVGWENGGEVCGSDCWVSYMKSSKEYLFFPTRPFNSEPAFPETVH